MKIKQVSQIDIKTGEFIGYCFVEKDSFTNEWLIPSDCVDLEVPNYNEYQKPVFENGQWVIKPDYRNAKVYNKQTKEQVEKKLGEDLKDDETLIPPIEIDYSKEPLYKQVRWNEEKNNWEIYNDEKIAKEMFNSERSKRFAETDWLILRHQDQIAQNISTTLTESQFQELLEYRQALRDMPQNPDFDVFNPQWPPKPDWLK